MSRRQAKEKWLQRQSTRLILANKRKSERILVHPFAPFYPAYPLKAEMTSFPGTESFVPSASKT